MKALRRHFSNENVLIEIGNCELRPNYDDTSNLDAVDAGEPGPGVGPLRQVPQRGQGGDTAAGGGPDTAVELDYGVYQTQTGIYIIDIIHSFMDIPDILVLS